MPFIPRKIDRPHSGGFTLVEILVSMTIFLAVSGSIIGAYNYILRINKRAQAIRAAVNNTRYMIESVSREIRNGKILYANQPTVCSSLGYSNPSPFLAIQTVDGDNECFYVGNSSGTSVNSSGSDFWLAKTSGGVVASAIALNPANVKVQNLEFIVFPGTDPYASGGSQQEMVTITGVMVASPDPRDQVSIPFQTTISLPLYDIP